MHAEILQSAYKTTLTATDAIPVAVGSGTVNDLAKYAASCVNDHLVPVPPPSMDGYAALLLGLDRIQRMQTGPSVALLAEF